MLAALTIALTAVLVGSGPGSTASADREELVRVGIIGLDTSHVVAFTSAMNDAAASGALASVRVVAAYPGGSPDIPSSRDRLAGFTADLKTRGVIIVDSIPALLDQVDAVLLESVDGRPHLDQVRPVFEAGKRVFIDKPLAGSLEDAVQIYLLGREHNVPVVLQLGPAVLTECRRPPRRLPARGSGRLRRVRTVQVRAPPPRLLLVRDPRRRDPVHDHGPRLRFGHPDPD